MNKLFLLRSNFLNPISPNETQLIRDGLLVIGSEGKITDFGDYTTLKPNYPDNWVQDFRHRLIMPGFIDLHTHLPQYEAIGMDGLELMDWLQTYIFPTESRFSDEEYAHRIIDDFFDDLLAEGTTTAVINATIHKKATEMMFKKAIDCQINAVIGKVMMDRNAPKNLSETTDDSLRESEELCQKFHGAAKGRIRYAFTPRFAYNCSPELMKGVGQLAQKYDARIQTHMSENRSSIKSTLQLFPDCHDYLEIYENAGMIGPKTLLAHGIYLSDSEYERLANSGTAIAHCPSSNLFLKSGIMNIRRMNQSKIRFGLGSDVGAGPNLSLFSEMHSAINASKARWFQDENSTILTPKHAFWLANLGGATALGMEQQTGNFTPGKFADFIITNFEKADPTELGVDGRSADEILSLLIYRGGKYIVERTYIRGKRVHG